MVRLRAEEHRYIISANGLAEALVRRIPGARFNAGAQAYQLPRQPGVVLALDELLGADGWECPADAAQEVSEARGRATSAAQQAAQVELQGAELAVACAFADKELVKLVPGYRWSAPQRRWFVPAAPMALDLLRRYFGELLEVADSAEETIALRRIDEDRTIERARAAQARPAAFAPPQESAETAVVAPGAEEEQAEEASTPAGAGSDLEARLDRLATAVEELVAIMKERFEQPIATGWAPHPEGEESAPSPVAEPAAMPLDSSWRETLARIESDPEAAAADLNPQLQLVGEEALPALRALLGIACSLQEDHQNALSFLRKAEEHSDIPLDPDLQFRARQAYRDSVCGLITLRCGPQRPISSLEGLEEMLLAELVSDSGFDDATLSSREALDLLSFLMDDAHMRSFDRTLADYCRVLHLLSLARGGKWMAAERVIEFLRNRDMTSDGFALGLIALANTVADQPSMEEWLLRWPPDTADIGIDDLRWIVANGIPRLQDLSSELAANGALAMLALIASAPVEVAPVEERRDLVRMIPPRQSTRRYAEFLAAYQLAEAGQKRVAQDFPGYLQVLASSPLSQSAAHFLTVFVNDSGGASSTTRRIAEEVFLESLSSRGVRDPQTEVLDLLDMLAESPRGDNLINQLAEMVEEDAFIGASTFSHDQRLVLFERAFVAAVANGRDIDSVRAFDRLIRERLRHGETEAVRTLCMGIAPGFKPLQLPVAQALLTLQLDAGEEFEATAGALLRLCHPENPADEGTLEAKGLAVAFPRFRDYLDGKLAEPEAPDLDFSDKRLVVVGGHEWLRKLAMPRFEEWGLKATWLDPDSAKNSSQALGLAAGAADLVIVNTACISHAASGRVIAESERAGTRYAFHNSRGLGALLSIAREGLADTEPPVTKKEPTAHDRRKKLLR